MKFATPQMFWLLLILVPPLIGFYWWAWRKRQELITQFISARLLGHLKIGVSPSRQKVRMAIMVVTVIFLILTLARPQWGVTREEARQRGLDIIVAIDTSNSMLAEDVSPNRLARAKLAALDLMRAAKTDRLGLVAFAGTAFLQCPLTLDDAAFSQSVNSLDTSTISQGGTALGEAIDEAAKAFKSENDNHKVVVLFTDGEDHDSDAVPAAQKAAKNGVIVFTIGIGTPEGEQLRIRDERGRVDYIRDENGQPVKSHLNEALLQDISRATKGFYLPLRGTKTMDTLYERGIAPLPKSESATKTFQRFHERFHWPLSIAMALLVLEMFLPDRGRRRSKRSGDAQTKPVHSLTETVAILLFVLLPVTSWSSPSSALREYNAGNYQDSLRDYNDMLQRGKNDPRLHFNAGTAAYQSQQLDAAAREFNEALASPDLQLQQRAYYNLGNTLYRAGQQLSDAEKKQAAWENAVKAYENASKLNQQDPDAKFNHDFVTKQLQELKKQQQQSKNGSGDKDQKNQKDQKDQDSKDGQKKKPERDQKGDDQQTQSKQNDEKSNGQDSQADNKAKQKSDEEKQQEKQDKQDKASQAGKEKKDDEKNGSQQAQAGQKSQEKPSEEEQREAAMMAAGQMTPQQAQQLLDGQKGDEKVFQLAPPNKPPSQNRSFKNW